MGIQWGYYCPWTIVNEGPWLPCCWCWRDPTQPRCGFVPTRGEATYTYVSADGSAHQQSYRPNRPTQAGKLKAEARAERERWGECRGLSECGRPSSYTIVSDWNWIGWFDHWWQVQRCESQLFYTDFSPHSRRVLQRWADEQPQHVLGSGKHRAQRCANIMRDY